MKTRIILPTLVMLIVGCLSHAPHKMAPDYAKKQARLVALMPVVNKANDVVAARLVREKMLAELYFKGYPKISLDLIDAGLLKLGNGQNKALEGVPSPQMVGGLMKVDAVLYCTLKESKTVFHYFYAPTSLAVSCDLRSATTGESLWQANYRDVARSFGYSSYDVKNKAAQVYEAVIKNVAVKVLETLPDGPDISG